MHVLAFNASPRKTQGNTHRILAPFMEGAAEAGATVETIMIRDLDVKPCTGCMSCWFITPEKCVQKDGMAEILDKVRSADVMVIGSPVYVDGLVGALKVVLDRMVPLLEPEMEMRDGHLRHPIVPTRSIWKVVLVSVCGLHEMDNFDPLVTHLEAVCRNMGGEYVGGLLRPHAHAMEAIEKLGGEITMITDAAREAGRQLVANGKMDPAVLAQVSTELIPQEAYLEGANKAIGKILRKHGTVR